MDRNYKEMVEMNRFIKNLASVVIILFGLGFCITSGMLALAYGMTTTGEWNALPIVLFISGLIIIATGIYSIANFAR